MKSLLTLAMVVTLTPTVMATAPLPIFFKVGHRGTRGMMPENTIPAMIRAIEDGANTLEFDVHITKDGKVVVYHDASFDPAYTTKPDGSEIKPEERGKYIFYQMNYSEIRPFRIGEKPYSKFPQQQRIRTYAPLLSEMIDSVEAYVNHHHKAPVYYLLEIKSSEKTDGKEQPAPEEYVQKLMEVKQLEKLKHRLLIQSFDIRPLQVLHKSHPKVTLGFLTGDKNVSFYQQLESLGFMPGLYNPHYSLVTKELLDYCHSKGMKIVPWTVADLEDMKRLKEMGVDGIITDYPDRINKI
ncbi:glycerophosphodiester phosphodiesterase family protein [Chitinophaga sancti]|uniref:Glycerophosphodiester phosphodiesterase family protein n=1 Tax=Chitinophaga sancti TaxID=1004 RepID=A0A1K1P3D3_9BACT|nr:glycerophosphodiester phosphodiesterase family protein [Chitinophaga sancti]WQD60442.1 glycerophosphodiester phosphodiesterase family protein [Chitinophaga sancti]WQG87430.1 glycerophosphodiester phosphodiesterase family protein [Chitinophaga sancti]SFW42092.1 glycerophosphoryl diester phosphodiesterase [Chitinophaga sancti]